MMVCLVTGSSRGLGKAIALAFDKRGHRVVVHYKDRKHDAESVASQIKESLVLQADVKESNEVKTLVDKVVEKWGTIDLLINNAGITKESLLIKTSENDFDDIVNTNLKGAFLLTRTVARYMIKKRSGQIINISSFAGLKGKQGLSVYSAAKSGLLGLTRTSAVELSRYNVMVNAVLPGYMMTDMGSYSTETAKHEALQDSLIKKYSEPDHVAEFICFLSERKGITGQVFNLDSRIV